MWWVFRAYAAGTDSRVVSALTDPRIVAIASRTGLEPDAAQVMIGHIGVTVDRQPADITVTLRGLDALPGADGDGCLDLVARRIPDTRESPAAEPEVAFQLRPQLDSNQVRATLPSPLAEHEVLILAVRKASCAEGLRPSSAR